MKINMAVPFCCGNALELYFNTPGFEYRCPECESLYEFFDGFERISWECMTDEQRGWIPPDNDQ